MKSTRTMIAVALLFAVTTTMFAQMENRTLMKVSIPFSFSVEDHTLPAGQYYVRSINPDHSIALVNADGGQIGSRTERGSPRPASDRVLSRTGGYVICQINQLHTRSSPGYGADWRR